MSNYLRKARLVVSSGSEGLDLSEFKFRFQIRNADEQSPNSANIRVYNLAKSTVEQIQNEFQNVFVEAGYENGDYGQIFNGTIKQFYKGKESNVDSFLEIVAADGDVFYNFEFVKKAMTKGATQQDIFYALVGDLPLASDAAGYVGGVNPEALARGKMLFGLARNYLRDWCYKNGFSWSLQNGSLTLTPINGYRKSEAVQINSDTGLIGIPEATDSGIRVTCELNPKIQVGCLIQINNADITQTVLRDRYNFPHYGDTAYAALVTDDGFYRVMVCEFVGDTRGQEWYNEIICLAVDTGSGQVQQGAQN